MDRHLIIIVLSWTMLTRCGCVDRYSTGMTK